MCEKISTLMNSFNAEEGIFSLGSLTKSSRAYISPTQRETLVQTLDVGVSILTISKCLFIQYIGIVLLVNTVNSSNSVGFLRLLFVQAEIQRHLEEFVKLLAWV